MFNENRMGFRRRRSDRILNVSSVKGRGVSSFTSEESKSEGRG